MVRLQTKMGQLAPCYVGPYTVVRKNRGNSYILRDHTGALMPCNFTSIELKLISHEEVIALDADGNELKSYEIEAILNHRGPPTKREYLVRWKHFSSDFDEWVEQSQFNATETLRDYWKKLGVPYTPKKSQDLTKAPTSIETLKKNPPGSISKLMNSFSADTTDSNPSVVTNTTSSNASVPNSSKRKRQNPANPTRRSKRRLARTNKKN